MITRHAVLAASCAIVLTACVRLRVDRASANRQASYRADSTAIRDAILRGAAGFEAADPDVILERYARDVVLAYPGEPDMNYDVLARSYAELRSRPKNVRATTVPTFDELLVSGDMAVVRLRWTTTITTPEQSTTRHMKDLQVWRRESDGRWMFTRGMHYREPDAKPAP
jgi:steroid delta-isomerase